MASCSIRASPESLVRGAVCAAEALVLVEAVLVAAGLVTVVLAAERVAVLVAAVLVAVLAAADRLVEAVFAAAGLAELAEPLAAVFSTAVLVDWDARGIFYLSYF